MAGEIYIADKITLDEVNSKVTDINSQIGVMSVSDFNKIVLGASKPTGASNVLNITTPGKIYYILGGATDSVMKITIDGSVFYYRTLPGTDKRAGIAYSPTGMIPSVSTIFPGSYATPYGNTVLPNSTGAAAGMVIMLKPLKFSTLRVDIEGTGTNTVIEYMYVLD